MRLLVLRHAKVQLRRREKHKTDIKAKRKEVFPPPFFLFECIHFFLSEHIIPLVSSQWELPFEGGKKIFIISTYFPRHKVPNVNKNFFLTNKTCINSLYLLVKKSFS